MEVGSAREALADDSRTDGFARHPNELPIRLTRKDDLRQPGNDKGIDEAQQNRGGDSHQDCGHQILFHCELHYARPMRVISRSITLMPMNGMMIPPTP